MWQARNSQIADYATATAQGGPSGSAPAPWIPGTGPGVEGRCEPQLSTPLALRIAPQLNDKRPPTSWRASCGDIGEVSSVRVVIVMLLVRFRAERSAERRHRTARPRR